MAASNAETETPVVVEKKVKERKKRSVIPLLFTVLLLCGAGIAIFAFNLFGLRDNIVYPLLSNIPVVKDYLPVGQEAAPDLSVQQLRERVTELENQLSEKDRNISELEERDIQSVGEINRLREFESQQLQFKQDKAAFDERIAMQDPQAFAEYYERMSPENAELLYPTAAAKSEIDGEIKRYISNFTEMDEEDAAAVLQQLVSTDMNLVVAILRGMNNRASSAVLGAMDAAAAASVSKMMAPDSMIGS
jgi:flagellar motility protein MotE (MotC chaperone)